MKVLGVDPGSRFTGWGLLEVRGSRSALVDAGVLTLGASSVPVSRRLGTLDRQLRELIERIDPAVASVETPFHGASSRDALRLAHARGVILAVLDQCGVELAEYSPASVKKAVTGNGRATKEQVRAMVTRLLDERVARAALDASDALAVALCHASHAGVRAAVDRAGSRAGDAGAVRSGPRRVVR